MHVMLDGVEQEGARVPLNGNGETHRVEAVIGAPA
jgi:hypothetical protein